MDVRGLPGGLVIHPEGELILYDSGIIRGDVTAAASVGGSGEISGDLVVGSSSHLVPGPYGHLGVGGDLSLGTGSWLRCEVPANLQNAGSVPRLEVKGSIHLQGKLSIEGFGEGLAAGDRIVLIANEGNDPIQGGFEGIAEGSVIPAPGGYGFRISYAGNGDGGDTGNDVILDVIPLVTSRDGRLTASAPLAVATGDEIEVLYALAGPTAGNEVVHLQVELPGNSNFLGSTPPGQLSGSILAIELPSVPAESTATAVIRLAAPTAPLAGTVRLSATCNGGSPGEPPARVDTLTAVLPGGRPKSPQVGRDPLDPGLLLLSFETLDGVRYVSETSFDLKWWYRIQDLQGTGEIISTSLPIYPEWSASGFYRFRIVPPVPLPEVE